MAEPCKSNIFLDSLNGISNTIWGVLILGVAIVLGIKGKTELCYYFAGIGSTLIGIKHNSEDK